VCGTGGRIDTFRLSTVRGGDAIAVVGHRTDGRFIVRNSSAPAGGSGFGYAKPDDLAAGFVSESHGITVAPAHMRSPDIARATLEPGARSMRTAAPRIYAATSPGAGRTTSVSTIGMTSWAGTPARLACSRIFSGLDA
jgi:hypothetical protein